MGDGCCTLACLVRCFVTPHPEVRHSQRGVKVLRVGGQATPHNVAADGRVIGCYVGDKVQDSALAKGSAGARVQTVRRSICATGYEKLTPSPCPRVVQDVSDTGRWLRSEAQHVRHHRAIDIVLWELVPVRRIRAETYFVMSRGLAEVRRNPEMEVDCTLHHTGVVGTAGAHSAHVTRFCQDTVCNVALGQPRVCVDRYADVAEAVLVVHDDLHFTSDERRAVAGQGVELRSVAAHFDLRPSVCARVVQFVREVQRWTWGQVRRSDDGTCSRAGDRTPVLDAGSAVAHDPLTVQGHANVRVHVGLCGGILKPWCRGGVGPATEIPRR
eukprot:PhM_4_TR13902/c0_g1_i1/m.96117